MLRTRARACAWQWVPVALAIALVPNPVTPAAAAPAAPTRVPLAVHVATEAHAPVVDRAFIDAQIARANQIFAPHAVSFDAVEFATLPDGHAVLDSRADRDALGTFARGPRLHCFFVRSLRDVDEPERMRRGVHWRSRTHAPAHYVIVSALAFEDVLAHELGHFLGNPQHSDAPGNLMSYTRTDALPWLDRRQRTRMRRALHRYFTSGELAPQATAGTSHTNAHPPDATGASTPANPKRDSATPDASDRAPTSTPAPAR